MKPVRAAVYTRKSSEEGLDQAFNSLDAQREACEAYIVSQKSEGWTLVRGHYDDGGWSGGNMDRPALRQLLADIEAGKIDVVVVYKVDRLSRSLSDFARMVELFDRHSVSFVSVTQAFNTTTSMGRLTLNVLLSFAQFEREVTGERIRDKIAASKAKGMWMGGYPPFGYDPKERTLVVNEIEAEIVRHIYRRYLKLGSVHVLRDELERDGVRSKQVASKGGITRGGGPFGRGALFHLLRNRLYLGEIVHKGVSYPGLHSGIVGPELFDAVQAKLIGNTSQRRQRVAVDAPLSGILYDALGRKMAATHARGRGGKRYLYYLSSAPASHADAPRVLRRVAAAQIEELVIERLRRWSGRPAAPWPSLTGFVKRIDLHRDAMVVQLTPPTHERWKIEAPDQWSTAAGALTVTSPVKIHIRAGRIERVDGVARQARGNPDKALIAGLRRAHKELGERGIELGDLRSPALDARGVEDPYLRKLTTLSFLAPDIQRAILDGYQPPELKLADLIRLDLPLVWDEQRRLLGVL